MTPPDRIEGDWHDDHEHDWHRLSPWMIAVKPVEQLPQLIPLFLAIAFAGRGAPDLTAIITLVALPLVTVVPWLATRYQVTAEHVRLRHGVLTRTTATARRDRIRSVDLTASPPHRILGLQKVRIGTGGDRKSSTVELNSIPAVDAERLRRHLMATAGRTPGVTGSIEGTESAAAQPGSVAAPEVLARFRPAWLRFAPFSLAGFATVAALVGLGFQAGYEAGLFERGATAAEHAADRILDIGVPIVVSVGIVVVIAAGALVSVVAYLLAYWGFTLTRTPDDDRLHLRRGLLTTIATSLDEHRVRGVHLHEPILMRPVRGARLNAIATGSSKKPLLMPPAPAVEVIGVGQLVTHEGDELTVGLRRHGHGALTRRLTRALWSGAVAAAVLVVAVAGPLTWPWLVLAAAVVVGAVALGVVRYRNLGVRVTDRAVAIAPPRVARHRYVVDRDGVVGWATSASFFQRRRGVETLTLATAAGDEAYAAVDLTPEDATGLMCAVSPDLVGPFVEPN